MPGVPLIYFNDGGGGGGGGLSDFFGSEILAKGNFFGSERCQDFLGSQKKTEGFFWVAKKELRDFFGYVKKVIFLGRQILKL